MTEQTDTAFSCTCGDLRGHLKGAGPSTGTHLICHCRDCRAALAYLDQPDPGPDGVDLYQTMPDRVRFTQGQDRLAILRLGPKGPLRWYAECCKAPLFITLSRPGLPFSTVIVARLDDPNRIGPVRAHAFVHTPGETPKHKGAGLMVWRLVTGMGACRLSGRWRQTPFFNLDTGTPNAPVHVLSKPERAALYD